MYVFGAPKNSGNANEKTNLGVVMNYSDNIFMAWHKLAVAQEIVIM